MGVIDMEDFVGAIEAKFGLAPHEVNGLELRRVGEKPDPANADALFSAASRTIISAADLNSGDVQYIVGKIGEPTGESMQCIGDGASGELSAAQVCRGLGCVLPHCLVETGISGISTIAAAIMKLTVGQERLHARLEQVAELLADETATVATPAAYANSARIRLRDVVLLQWLGLTVLEGAMLQRVEGDIHVGGRTMEWDFRAPVLVSAVLPARAEQHHELTIYPSHQAYMRPARPLSSRHLTPTKLPGASAPPDLHYIAIFEVTTSTPWTKGKKSLLFRLEERLHQSLDRANSLQPKDATLLRITDVVAVVGVVGVSDCQQSVGKLMHRSDAPPLLRELMLAARFVFVYLRFDEPSESGSPA